MDLSLAYVWKNQHLKGETDRRFLPLPGFNNLAGTAKAMLHIDFDLLHWLLELLFSDILS